jgi:sterol desaturase/sphingolipid hydroxylase (fatty acid hydroxylase superfamily)
MGLPGSEALLRLTAFSICFALLAAVEAVTPGRRRTVGRRSRWVGNLGLVTVATILVRAIPFASSVGMAGLAEAHGWGLLQAIRPIPAWAAIAGSVVLLDLAIYLQHVMFHALPLLWRLHRVHHTDPELDVTTGVRFHPLEILLSAGFKVAVVGVLGAPVAGAIVFEIVLNAGSLWTHANLRLPATPDRLLRIVIVTPNMHRVHHSIDRAETDRNFGFTLSWWDGLFGTYEAALRMGHEAMVVGVAGFGVRDALGLGRLLVQPILREPDVPSGRRQSFEGTRTFPPAANGARTNTREEQEHA